MSNVSGLSWLEFLHLFQCIHKVGIVLSCATLTMRLAVFAVRCCGHEGQFLKMPFRKVGKINTALARAYTTLNRLHLFVGNASSYCFAFVRVAIIEFAFLIADGRDGRQRPINRHSIFVHECRLSMVDRTLWAATPLARQRLFMAASGTREGLLSGNGNTSNRDARHIRMTLIDTTACRFIEAVVMDSVSQCPARLSDPAFPSAHIFSRVAAQFHPRACYRL